MKILRSRLPTILGDLRSNRAFLRLLFGRLVTNAGDSLYFIAAMWLVYDLSGSPLYTGLAGFLVRAPAALSFLTGPLVDRWPIRRLLVVTQSINGLLVLAIPIAAWTGHLSIWVVLASLPIVTFVNEFVYPAQNAVLPRIVEETNLSRANSLMSGAYQAANMVFNATSGVLVPLVGAVALFVVDSATFGAALLLFGGMTIPTAGDAARSDAEADGAESATETDEEGEAATEADGYLDELRDGVAYLRGSLLVELLVGVVATNFIGGAIIGVLPAFAATIGGASTYGLLMGAYAGGTLTGTAIASWVEQYPLGKFVVGSFVTLGVALAAALALSWFPTTLTTFYLTFVPIGAFNVHFWTILQSSVDNDLLGRVSSLMTSAGAVAVPVGSLVGGAVAGAFGSRLIIYSWAAGSVAFGLYVAVRPGLRSLPAPPSISGSTLGLPENGTAGESNADERPDVSAVDTVE